jgi:hypothetical protein
MSLLGVTIVLAGCAKVPECDSDRTLSEVKKALPELLNKKRPELKKEIFADKRLVVVPGSGGVLAYKGSDDMWHVAELLGISDSGIEVREVETIDSSSTKRKCVAGIAVSVEEISNFIERSTDYTHQYEFKIEYTPELSGFMWKKFNVSISPITRGLLK